MDTVTSALALNRVWRTQLRLRMTRVAKPTRAKHRRTRGCADSEAKRKTGTILTAIRCCVSLTFHSAQEAIGSLFTPATQRADVPTEAGQIASPTVIVSECEYRVFRLIRSVGFSKRSCPVKHEVPCGETEVLSGETVFHNIAPRVFHRENKWFL